MQLVAIRPTASPVAHPFGVVWRAEVDCPVVGAGGERVRCPTILHNIPHRSAVYPVHAPSGLLVVGVDDHYVERVGGVFYFFASADFAAAEPVTEVTLATVPMGGTTAAGRPPLVTAMAAALVETASVAAAEQAWSPSGALVPTVAVAAASCSGCVTVRHRSLNAASG